MYIAGWPALLQMCKDAGVLNRTVALPYSTIEAEPSYPATRISLEGVSNILRVVHGFPDAAGAMGNVQCPLIQFPRTHYLLSSLWNRDYMSVSEATALTDASRLLYPEHAQFVADCFAALNSTRPGETTEVFDRLHELTQEGRLGQAGAYGRTLFPNSNFVAESLIMQLRLQAAQQRLFHECAASPTQDALLQFLEMAFDAYLTWDEAHGWHDLWGASWPPRQSPVFGDQRMPQLLRRLRGLESGNIALEHFLSKLTTELSRKHDEKNVRAYCIEPLKRLALEPQSVRNLGQQAVVLNDDGGWCWFEDPRVVVDGGKVVLGTVANGSHDPRRKGDIEVVSYDLAGGVPVRSTLHKNLQADDHDSPALLLRPDGRWLALYAMHGAQNRIYYRLSVRPHDATEWQPEKVFVPSPSTRVTYSNPHLLGRENVPMGRIYNFFRGYDNTAKPSWMFSDDWGESWKMGGLLVDFQAARKHRPYVKYASDGLDTIHFAFTEGHPMEFDTGIYHAVYRAGQLCDSGGKPIRALTQGPIAPAEATRVFAGDSNNIAWIHSVALDNQGRPWLVFTVQKNAAGLPKGGAGQDLRYHFARWDGSRWHNAEIAYAGSSLYLGEDDYAGGIHLHPRDPSTVFISANVNPTTGKSRGRFEIYSGRTGDQGATWTWTAVTQDSQVDNLRPIVVSTGENQAALLWLRGRYLQYINYDLQVVLRRL
jgi:hypothetical protein